MVTIYIDNKPYDVKEGQSLLQACLSLGFDIPYFCWHPALKSVGACRQCAVKVFRDEKDTRGRIVMSCMTAADDGTRLSIDDPDARKFRASVIEWLMLNHPHDCPVCDEGGECHLQDMTVMTGHVYRKTRFKKRTHRNQDLGPFVNHEMNRCIQCYRCTRFYNDYAMGRDFGVFASHDSVYFGRHQDGVLESSFSGNLVEICPTGVFTDKTFRRHYTRSWDLQTAPSICRHCGIGCNTIPAERYGTLRRIRNRYNSEVNGYFLCDRGRFGYDFVNSARRILQPMLRETRDGVLQRVTNERAIAALTAAISSGARVIGIGSPRAPLEANFVLRALVGPARFYAGFSETEHKLLSAQVDILQNGPASTPSLARIATADAVFLLGEDVTNTAPMLDLALRQSVWQKPLEIAVSMKIPLWDDKGVRNALQSERGPFFIAGLQQTMLDEIATATYRAAPDDIARLGFAVAHAIDPHAPDVSELSEGIRSLAERIAAALVSAKRPLVISGPGCGSLAVMRAAGNVARALKAKGLGAELCLTTLECNSLGLALMEAQPLGAAFEAVERGEADTVILLENDLYRRAEATRVNRFLETCKRVIVLDQTTTLTTARADLVMPAATFAEADGTLVNNEGRAQRSYRVFPAPEGVLESWRWLVKASIASGRSEAASWKDPDSIISALGQACRVFARVAAAAPPASFRIAGQKIPRQPHRYSGRTAMGANISVNEPKQPEDMDSPLAFSMEGYEGVPPSPLMTRFWAPGWNSIQSVNKFQSEIAGPLLGGDPGKRLLEPKETSGSSSKYFEDVPGPFQRRSDGWLVVPAQHIFGSEELSALSPAIAERTPAAYVGLNPQDASSLGVTEGERVELLVATVRYELPSALRADVPAGVAFLPVGLPGVEMVLLPVWGTVRRVA
ncbi:MAG TPA: NADH-quinone oxidoreductase subunit NuoG [Syntrophorhabdales bacterium]|nr:NADH-quinone oxidoreductase subunit NuoG [Syntrophorhabdales bacterium]